MDKIVIEGRRPLVGKIPISGAKNSAIKLMAASLLTDGELRLDNMPNLADTRFMADLLRRLGAIVERPERHTMTLQVPEVVSAFAPYDLVRKMRATFNVLGPLLAREGHAKVSLPGGCAIGARPVDLHLQALKALGAHIDLHEGYVYAQAPRGLSGGRIAFPMVSVGATEHALLAAVLAKGETVIENAAREPEITDLAECLNAMGAKISGLGTSTLTLQGVDRLLGTTHSVVPDRIETGTYAIAAAITGGDVELVNTRTDLLTAFLDKLRAAGVTITQTQGGFRVQADATQLQAVDVETAPYPGFPTDLQAQFMALMTVANGESHISETIFENRFLHAPELMRLGADIHVQGPVATVRGVRTLEGAPVMATDLRASVSLVLAGLVAEGKTTVNRVYHLDRGFENLEEKLTGCGAQIERMKESQTQEA